MKIGRFISITLVITITFNSYNIDAKDAIDSGATSISVYADSLLVNLELKANERMLNVRLVNFSTQTIVFTPDTYFACHGNTIINSDTITRYFSDHSGPINLEREVVPKRIATHDTLQYSIFFPDCVELFNEYQTDKFSYNLIYVKSPEVINNEILTPMKMWEWLYIANKEILIQNY